MYQVNVQGTSNVLRAASDAGVARVVHTSSIAALGLEPGRFPSTEETGFNQHGKAIHYALSKNYAEREALRWADDGLPVVVVNPSFPFGAGDRRPTPTGRIIVNILRGLYFAYGPGGINAVEVEDVARGHVLALDHGRPGRRYLLTGHDVDWAEFYALVKRLGDVRRRHFRLPYPVLRGLGLIGDLVGRFTEPLIDSPTVRYAAQHFHYDCTRAKDELGYTVAPLEDTVARAVAWFRAEGYA
jgi:dihydroflavonol-4-reductase